MDCSHVRERRKRERSSQARGGANVAIHAIKNRKRVDFLCPLLSACWEKEGEGGKKRGKNEHVLARIQT